MAATAKRLFYELELMSGSDEKKLLALVEAAKRKLDLAATKNEHDEELLGQRREFLRELEHTELRAKAAVLDQVVAAGLVNRTEGRIGDALAHSVPSAPPPTPDAAPLLSKVIRQFLTKYPAKKKEMLKKHQTVLRLLLEVLGDRPVSSLKQMDLNGFFDLLHRLPPRWSDELRKRKCSVRELSAMHHPKLMGPKTFDDTYKASVRAFLVAAKKDWRDQGFPEAIATDGIEYLGDRESDEKKQREFYPEELKLKRLFEGNEMRGFAVDVGKAHYYWLPLLGLFTGARVNEICQINPSTDIGEEGSIPFFWLTIETEGDPRVSKSLKNKGSRRKLPIHSKLIELGFLSYVD
jgi:integrase